MFERLTPPPDNGQLTFSAVPLPRQEYHKLAKDAAGAPCLLLCVRDTAPRPAPIRLEHLSVEHNAHCTIHTTEGETEGHFTILRCHDAPAPLHDLFLRFAAPLLHDLPEHPTPADIHHVVSALVELFRAAATPGTKTVRGLWAELFLIAQADNPGVLVQAWHATPEDRYDFANGPKRIEVKSAGTRVRQHHFSLEQLTPPPGTRVVIASVFTERSAGGASIADLLDRITSMVDSAALQAQAQRITYLALGNTWREAMTTRFDTELATASLRFVDAAAVPSITAPLPPGVTLLRFCSDLTAAPALSIDDLQGAGGLLAAARAKIATRPIT
jgi:hypothetical protein